MGVYMNSKKMIIINTLLATAISFLVHYIYKIIPNYITAIFFPVNESIWEHMKMLTTTILVSSIIEYFINKKYNIINNNYLLSSAIKSIIIIPIYLLIFLPIFYTIGENMIVAITVMIISIFIVNYINYKLLQLDYIKYEKCIGASIIIITYIAMGILTFKPLKNDLFLDTKEEKYDINDYLIKK